MKDVSIEFRHDNQDNIQRCIGCEYFLGLWDQRKHDEVVYSIPTLQKADGLTYDFFRFVSRPQVVIRLKGALVFVMIYKRAFLRESMTAENDVNARVEWHLSGDCRQTNIPAWVSALLG